MKTIIHINQHKVRANNKNSTCEPVITCKTYKENQYAHSVVVLDKEGNEACRVIYSPDKPLSCGARVWIETNNKIIMEEKPSEN